MLKHLDLRSRFFGARLQASFGFPVDFLLLLSLLFEQNGRNRFRESGWGWGQEKQKG